MSAEPAPEQFGRYILHERIGRGGMAEIFRASYKTGKFEKALVVKRILEHLADEEDFIELFRDEAAISASLSHANIVQVFDFGVEGQSYFLAMEYVDGRNLRQILQQSKDLAQPALPVDFAAFVAAEVARGLVHAHTRKDPVIHRDVTPANILVSFEGDVKIADFGIARVASRLGSTREGVVRGKIRYLAPEQLGQKTIDARVDVWALGVVLWEMLTGARLVGGDTDMEILAAIATGNFNKRPSELRPSIPPELDRVVERALQVDLTERYASAAAMLSDLQPIVARLGVSGTQLAATVRRLYARTENKADDADGTANLDTDPGKGPSILLVHPDPRIRRTVSEAIRTRAGLTVVEAVSIPAAEEVARTMSPFAVLLAPDLVVEDCSRLYERLGERATVPVRVIALTHNPRQAQVEVAYKQGMSFLLKPLEDGARLADVLSVFARAPHGGAPEEPGTPGVRTVGAPAILVVDDSATIRSLLSRLFVSRGYRVFVASDAATALRFLKEKEAAVDLVVSDLNMPGMDGFELKHEIDRIRSRPLPFVLVTSETDTETQALAAKVGTSAFIPKPIDPDELLDTVAKVLRASGLRVPG